MAEDPQNGPVLAMTVPTAGTRRELLEALIADCGLPRERIVIVATRPGLDLPAGVRVVEDLGPPNIQRWWARGIAEAEALGATAVAVLNDDIRLEPATLPALHDALRETGAAIASPSRDGIRDGLHKRPLIPYEPRLWGSLWVLDVASGLRPDPRYRWWYGDNDLDIRARTRHGGVVLVPVAYEHVHPSTATFQNPDLLAIADDDAKTFERQYRRLLRMSRLASRWARSIRPARRQSGQDAP